MTVNFVQTVYLPAFAAFARPVTFYPIASQPGEPPFEGRGIFDTERIDLESLDGARFSETHTTLDVLETEFAVVPKQGDRVSIPPHELVRGGEYIVSDRSAAGNAGGMVTLQLRKFHDVPKLIGP